MSDDDELGLSRQAAHVAGVAGDVGIVQRRLDLVHDAEWCGMDFQNGEVQGNCHEGLLAAGEQRDGLEGFSGRLGLDLNAAAQDVVLVLQLQLGGTAAKQFSKGGLEALGEQLELLRKDDGHLVCDLLDDTFQFALGLFHVVALVGQVGIAAIDPLELLDGSDVDIAQSVDVPLQLADAAGGLGHALQLDPLSLRIGVGEFIVFPQAIQNLLLLHGGGSSLLFQTADGPLQIQQILIHLLTSTVLGGALSLQGNFFFVQCRQTVSERLGLL